LVRRIIAELDSTGALPADHTVAVIATGGLATLVVPYSETVTTHEPDLTLTGLRLLFDRNK
jgi:type III pantothenate kinase